MKDFGTFLKSLLDARGITQTQFARAIGKTYDTVGKVVQGRGSWPKSTAARAFLALNAHGLSQDDAYAFLDHFGLDRNLYHSTPPPPPEEPAPAPAAPRLAEALTLLGRLIEQHGLDRALGILQGAIATEPTRELTLISPIKPSSVPGAIEHTETTYEKSPAAIKRALKKLKNPPK